MSAGDPRIEAAAGHIFRVTPYPLDVAAKLAAEVLAAADAAVIAAEAAEPTPAKVNVAGAGADELAARLAYVAHRLDGHRPGSSIARLLREAATELTMLREELVVASLDR